MEFFNGTKEEVAKEKEGERSESDIYKSFQEKRQIDFLLKKNPKLKNHMFVQSNIFYHMATNGQIPENEMEMEIVFDRIIDIILSPVLEFESDADFDNFKKLLNIPRSISIIRFFKLLQ